MTTEERWKFVLDKRAAVLCKSVNTTEEKNFLDVFDMYANETTMPQENLLYFLYSSATRLKDRW